MVPLPQRSREPKVTRYIVIRNDQHGGSPHHGKIFIMAGNRPASVTRPKKKQLLSVTIPPARTYSRARSEVHPRGALQGHASANWSRPKIFQTSPSANAPPPRRAGRAPAGVPPGIRPGCIRHPASGIRHPASGIRPLGIRPAGPAGPGRASNAPSSNRQANGGSATANRASREHPRLGAEGIRSRYFPPYGHIPARPGGNDHEDLYLDVRNESNRCTKSS
jgi:hypothetical protein